MRRLLACLLVLTLSVPAAGSLWDYDTRQMDHEQLPGPRELIAGKVLRHGDAFYEWRAKDRQKKIASHDPEKTSSSSEQLARAYDDLAVALHKLGRHDEAIETIREKADRLPNVGEYETHANLGTFLAQTGRLEDGLAELKKAIEINPDAPFGRETFQVLLIEYMLEKQGGQRQTPLPLGDASRHEETIPSFVKWLLSRQGLIGDEGRILSPGAAGDEIERAFQGVMGLMWFGDDHAPVLLEVLGDLLVAREQGALAARAYLRAGAAADSAESRQRYRSLAEAALATQNGKRSVSLSALEDQLAREVHEAEDWFDRTIVYDEELWIEESADPDAVYWKKYGGQTIRLGHDRLPAAKFAFKGLPIGIMVALGVALVATFAGLAGLIAWRRRYPTGYDDPSV